MTEDTTTPQTQAAQTAVADRPNLWQGILSKVIKPKPTGAACEYCGWRGTKDDVLRSPRLNEDGVVYQITTCPSCLRNGGVVVYD